MSEILTAEMMLIFVFLVSMFAVCMIIWEAFYFERRGSLKKKTGAETRHLETNN